MDTAYRLAVLALVLIASAVFASTVISVPSPSPLPIGFERMSPLPFRAQISRLSHRLGGLFASHPRAAASRKGTRPLTVAFYTSWTDESAPSLEHHIDTIDWVAPTLLSLDGAGRIEVTDDPPLRRIVGASLHRPLVVPVLQNIVNGVFVGDTTATVLHDPAKRRQIIAGLDAYLDKTGDGGIVFDFENIPAGGMADYRTFLAEANADFDRHQRIVAVTLPIDNPAWSPRDFAPVADKLFLMAYDQHWQGGQPGPIAADAWFADRVAKSLRGLPPGKAIVTIGNYGYDWHDGHADSLTVEEAWLSAHDSGAAPVFDHATGNSGFSFLDDGHRHDVWMLDAATSWNQLHALSRLGVTDVALWRLGSEDPGFWRVLSAWRQGDALPDIGAIEQRENADVEGTGEILRVADTPHPGRRVLSTDPQSGLVRDETYRFCPRPM